MKQKAFLYYLLASLVSLTFLHIASAEPIFDDVDIDVGEQFMLCNEGSCTEYTNLGEGRVHLKEKPLREFESIGMARSVFCGGVDNEAQSQTVICSKGDNDSMNCVKFSPFSHSKCVVEELKKVKNTEVLDQEPSEYNSTRVSAYTPIYTPMSLTNDNFDREIFCSPSDCIEIVEKDISASQSVSKISTYDVSILPMLHETTLNPIDIRMGAGGGGGGGMWELRVSSSIR